MKNTLTLYELNCMVRENLEQAMPDTWWVGAEVSEIREVRGNCYMELVQKDPQGNTPIAKASAKCWRSAWPLVSQHFARVTGSRLSAGMQVLLQVYAQFHEQYGFSWIVTDIDPTYTLGDMARKRNEVVRKLKEEGVFDLNKQLALPLFAQRIAVVSSNNAAGYGDFCKQLSANAYGFAFEVKLFPAVMQGEQVETSVIAALTAIYENVDDYDVVVIIRGGGATSDLSGFDTLALAEHVANFPLPVITGIGHDRDESVLDLVAFANVKTPTAAATYLTEHLKAVSDHMELLAQRMVNGIRQRMDAERTRMEHISSMLSPMVKACLKNEHHRIDLLAQRMPPSLKARVREEQHRLQLLAQRVAAADPVRMLSRGYSITLHEGRVVTDASQLHQGDQIVTRLAQGEVAAVVSGEQQ